MVKGHGFLESEEPDGAAGGNPVLADSEAEEEPRENMMPSDIFVSQIRRGDILRMRINMMSSRPVYMWSHYHTDMELVVVRKIEERKISQAMRFKAKSDKAKVIDVTFIVLRDGSKGRVTLKKYDKVEFIGRSMRRAKALLFAEAL